MLKSMHFCVVSHRLATETIHFYMVSCSLAVFLAASGAPPSGSWLLLAGGGSPRPGNPWFKQLYMEKLADFRQSNINLSILRQEFEADILSDRIFTSKSARQLRGCDREAFHAPSDPEL